MKSKLGDIFNKSAEISMSFDVLRPNGAAIDIPHGVLILGALMSSKPQSIVELGIGTGFVTSLIFQGIEYNNTGELTCVDNLHDFGGHLKPEILEKLKKTNAKILAPMQEKEFVYQAENNSYDFLVSDADHFHAGDWAEEIFRIMKPDSFMFFHDVNPRDFPNLMRYKTLSDELGKPNFLFTKCSRNDEICERGLLMVVNKK